MYITALFDQMRYKSGLAVSAWLTNSTAGDLDQYQNYKVAVNHVIKDLLGTGLSAPMVGCTRQRSPTEFYSAVTNDLIRRTMPGCVLPTFIRSLLSSTAISPTDRVDVPAEGLRWRTGTARGFQFDWLSIKDKPFLDNLMEYNTYGPNTNGGALLVKPSTLTSWSKIYNVGFNNCVRWYDFDLILLPQGWNTIPELEVNYMTYSVNQICTLPCSGFVFATSAPGDERTTTTTMVVKNDQLEASNSLVLRDKVVHNVGASVRNTPYSAEIGVNFTFDLIF